MPSLNFTRHSRALGVLSILSIPALGLAGCKDKAATTEESAPQDASADGGEAAAGKGTAAASGPRATKGSHDAHFPTAIPTFRHGDGIFGHVVLNDVSNLLAELGQVAPPMHKGKFDEAALRALAAMALEQRGVIAQNINLKAPMGCALLDFKKYPEAPAACAIGYKGGAAGLVRDLGAQGKLEDAKGHLAAFDLNGQTLFIDELESHAALSIYPGVFAEAREYLEANIVKRAAGLTGNIEASLFISSLLKSYPEEVKPFLDQLDSQNGSQYSVFGDNLFPEDKDKAAKVSQALEEASSMGGGSQRENLENSLQASLSLGLHSWGFQVGGALVPAEGSNLLALAKLADDSADRTLALELPAAADGFFSAYQSPKAWRSEPLSTNLNTICGVWAAITAAADPGVCAKTIQEINTSLEKTNTGKSVVFHAPLEGSTLGGFGAVTRTTGDRRALFVDNATKASVAALLGPRAAESISYTFEPEARTHDGVTIDRMSLRMTDAMKARIQKDAKGPDKAIADAFVSSALVIERAEIDGRTLLAMAINGDEGFTNDTIDALQGKGTRIGAALVNGIFDHHPQAQTIGAFNPQALVNAVRNLLQLTPNDPQAKRLLTQLPTNLSTDVSTIRVYSDILPSGTGAFQLLLDPGFLAEVVDRAMNASQGPAMGGPAMGGPAAAPSPASP
ncbi:MAG: hypothetical protein ACPHRO_00010 [Nannocystaceae bacterium]